MKKRTEIIISLSIWVIICSLVFSSFYNFWKGSGNLEYPSFWALRSIAPIIIIAITTYLFAYLYLVPEFLQRKKFLAFIILLLLSSFLIAFLSQLQSTKFMVMHHESFSFILSGIFVFSTIAVFGGIIGSLAKASILWYNSIAERQASARKHMESQTALLMLKAQLNPHFLFNSLNNIDVLIEENPQKASDYLTKFSDILRYVLYDTKEEESELARELEQIKNYIDLQKIRSDNPHFVKYQVTGELKDQKIAPMIFLPFIENAFKHSKNKTLENSIEIEFILSDSSVKMVCRNYYEASQVEVIKSEGLGIETIKQRLNLLYPEKHKLNIEKTQHCFDVTLIINL